MNWKEVLVGAAALAVMDYLKFDETIKSFTSGIPGASIISPAAMGAITVIIAEWLGKKF